MAVATYLSRKTVGIASIVLACCIVGAAWGWYDIAQAQQQLAQEQAGRPVRPEPALHLPPAPPDPDELAEREIDPADQSIWELATKEPLAVRKEPLTPPNWKIVGVTGAGDDKSVLLLYENQPTVEIRKIGEKLPGGAKIVDITQDYLRILLDGKPLKLSLRK